MQQLPLCPLSNGYRRIAARKIVNATFWVRRLEPPALPADELALRGVAAENSPSISAALNRIGADSLWDRAAELNRRPDANPGRPEEQVCDAFDDPGGQAV